MDEKVVKIDKFNRRYCCVIAISNFSCTSRWFTWYDKIMWERAQLETPCDVKIVNWWLTLCYIHHATHPICVNLACMSGILIGRMYARKDETNFYTSLVHLLLSCKTIIFHVQRASKRERDKSISITQHFSLHLLLSFQFYCLVLLCLFFE